MRRGVRVMVWVFGALTSVSAVARAECTKDTDCKGDRVCEQGVCRSPMEPPPPEVAAEARSANAPPPSSPPAVLASEPDTHFFDEEAPRKKPKKRIGNPGMMVGGIVLVSAAPIVLVAGVLSTSCDRDTVDQCDAGPRLLGFAAISLIMIGAGVPLIVIGAKRVPVRQVSAVPWLGPRDAGLRLRFDL